MGDVERITTTERPVCKFHGLPLDADGHCPYKGAREEEPDEWFDDWDDDDEPDPLATFEAGRKRGAADERVRVVEGLVATIKALPTGTLLLNAHDKAGKTQGHYCMGISQTAVLAVVEAAREDTT